MSDAVHADVEAILEMEAACARFAAAVTDRLPGVATDLRQVSEALEERRAELRGEMARLRDEIASADEDTDTGYLERQIEDAEEEQSRLRRRLQRLDDAAAAYQREARKMELLASDGVSRAREFLRGTSDDLKAYLATNLDGDSAPGGSASPAGSGIAPAGFSDLTRMPLPEGFVWVPISEIDRSPDRGGFEDEPQFEKVPRDEMVRGFDALRGEVLPALASLGAEQCAAWCMARDQQTGRTVENGVQRVFEAFFGQDHIYLTRGRDQAHFDVTSGKHRIHVAAGLGWPAVPARVSDLHTP